MYFMNFTLRCQYTNLIVSDGKNDTVSSVVFDSVFLKQIRVGTPQSNVREIAGEIEEVQRAAGFMYA